MKPKLWKIKTHLITREVFQYSLIAYLILLVAETIKPGFVSFFFNLNIVLVIVFLSGIVMVLTHQQKLDEHIDKEKEHKLRKKDIPFIILLSLGGAFLVWFKTQNLEIVSIILSVLTAVMIVLLSLLVFLDKE